MPKLVGLFYSLSEKVSHQNNFYKRGNAMKSFIVFTFKEIIEQLKTFKALVIMVILLLFGIGSPLLAKLMPEMFKMMDVGFEIQLPDPTYIDSYAQFFKNIGQMAFIVMLLIYSGSVVHEKVTGTAIMMLTKKLSRPSFIISKFISSVILWTISYTFSAIACAFYTNVLFPKVTTQPNIFTSMLILWLFGTLLLAITTFASTLANNQSIATVGAFVGWFILIISGTIPKVKDYSPNLLSSKPMEILSGTTSLYDLTIPIILCLALIIALLWSACFAFSKQEI